MRDIHVRTMAMPRAASICRNVAHLHAAGPRRSVQAFAAAEMAASSIAIEAVHQKKIVGSLVATPYSWYGTNLVGVCIHQLEVSRDRRRDIASTLIGQAGRRASDAGMHFLSCIIPNADSDLAATVADDGWEPGPVIVRRDTDAGHASLRARVRIRSAVAADLPFVLQEMAISLKTGLTHSEACFYNLVDFDELAASLLLALDQRGAELLVAEVPDGPRASELVGYALVAPEPPLGRADATSAFLYDVLVRDDEGGRGVGAAMTAAAIDIVRGWGRTWVDATVMHQDPTRKAAILAMVMNIGWKPVSTVYVRALTCGNPGQDTASAVSE